jgi:CDP-diacylglycerol--glycerol-3-phosphate 3-phosphatidyltransferase
MTLAALPAQPTQPRNGAPAIRISDAAQANVPNTITLVRTAAAITLACLGLAQHSLWLIAAAYAAYWIGDVLDGLSARLLHQETRFGAVFDIISDRACYGLAVAGLTAVKPDLVVPCIIFMVQFLVLDTMLSLSFLRWPLLSPNYFYQVHRGLYRWNWWPPAKVVNTTVLVLTVFLSDHSWISIVAALAVTAVKAVSLVVVSRLPQGGTGDHS